MDRKIVVMLPLYSADDEMMQPKQEMFMMTSDSFNRCFLGSLIFVLALKVLVALA